MNKLKQYYETKIQIEHLKTQLDQLSQELKDSLGTGKFTEDEFTATVYETTKTEYRDNAVVWLKDHGYPDCVQESPNKKQINLFIEQGKISDTDIKKFATQTTTIAIKVTKS